MNYKLRQSADTVHETIYLSEFESQLMATPFFNRLHDVYQSSTVYKTFPTNRTKRYEHSVGTMHLAGSIFYHAIVNSDKSDKIMITKKLDEEFEKIVAFLAEGKSPNLRSLDTETLRKDWDFYQDKNENDILKETISSQNLSDSIIRDISLNHFMPNFSFDNNDEISDILKNRNYLDFLFQCLLESVRVVGLFHDIGHPPYSHITEDVINDIYNQPFEKNEEGVISNTRQKTFFDSVSRFKENSIAKELCRNMAIAKNDCNEDGMDLHESIGLQLLKLTLEFVFEKILTDIHVDGELKSLYFLTVTEFIYAILLNKNSFWKAIHSIVDGTIDADRLDYIVRDSINSGVDWGKIPYRRLIESLVYKHIDNNLVLTFPIKSINILDDVLELRYKVFSIINYHHRSIKSASLLKKAIREISLEYLEDEAADPHMLNSISMLWRSLSSTYTTDKAVRNIGLWNDSHLMTILYSYWAKHQDTENSKNKVRYLEDLLFDIRHYHSVIKRNRDMQLIYMEIFNTLESKIQSLGLESEEYKRNKSLFSIIRNKEVQRFDVVDKFIGMSLAVYDLATDALTDLKTSKTNKTIEDFMVFKANHKTISDDVMLYDYKKGEFSKYMEYSNIKNKADIIQQDSPFLFIYLSFKKGTSSEDIQADIEKSLYLLNRKVSDFCLDRFDEIQSMIELLKEKK